MLYKSLDLSDLRDLQGLCERKVLEGTQLDYKETLPSTDERGKKDFLQDVTALANTSGGDLIYGLREEREGGEKTGAAGEVVGVEGLRFDETRLWMENLLRDNTDPRLLGVGFRRVVVDENRSALIVRVPRSWNGPHAVSYGNHWRFYARNSGGNYKMDVAQLRDVFLAGSTLQDKLEAFRSRRLETLISALLARRPCMVLHLQPFESARPGFLVDLQTTYFRADDIMLAPWVENSVPSRHNFDGLRVSDGNSPDYLQIYRSGMTEEVDTRIFIPNDQGPGILIDAVKLDRHLFRALGRRLALLKGLGITSPVMIQLSLLGVQGCKLLSKTADPSGNTYGHFYPHEIDRPSLVVPGKTIENIQDRPLEKPPRTAGVTRIYPSWEIAQPIVRELLDIIWNAAGEERCLHYDHLGKYRGSIT